MSVQFTCDCGQEIEVESPLDAICPLCRMGWLIDHETGEYTRLRPVDAKAGIYNAARSIADPKEEEVN